MAKFRFLIMFTTSALVVWTGASVTLAAVPTQTRTIVFPTDPTLTTFSDNFAAT